MTQPTPNTADDVAVAKTALVVVDAQNSFLHPDGGNYWDGAQSVVEPLQRLITSARANDVLIVHVADRHRTGVHDSEFDRLPRHCVRDEFDAEFFDGFGLQPDSSPTEITVEKRRYSAFFGTDLSMVLHENNIDTIVLGGVKTNVCVRATATDAFGHGFTVQLVGDAVASNRPNLHEASLEDVDRYIGSVVTLDHGIEQLLSRSGSPAA